MKEWKGSWYGIEFWKEEAERTFDKAKVSMMEHGFTEKEAVALLLEVYAVMAGEFGE